MEDSSIIYDLCIIGAGIFGCAAAKHATGFRRLNICLIGPDEPTKDEWGHRRIFSSHYDEGRIVRKHLLHDEANVLVEETFRDLKSLEKLSGKKLFSRTGGLFMFGHDHESISEISNEIISGKNHLLDISSDAIFSNKFPHLKLGAYKYVLLDPASGHVSPREIIKANKFVAEKNGCHIINDIVKDIKEVDGDMIEISTEAQRLVKAKKLLICAGAFTNFIPLHTAKELDIKVEKESYILIRISEQEAERLRDMPVVDTFIENFENQPFLKGAYILPPIKYPDGKYYLKIGHIGSIVNSELSSLDEIKNWYHSNGDKYIAEHYPKLIQDLIPGLKIEEIIRKTCVTCSNLSNLPYIDSISPNVIVAAVGNGGGVTMCEAVGRIAAKLSVEAMWDSELPKELFQAIFRVS